jgi:acyl-CoA thioester hydrolase
VSADPAVEHFDMLLSIEPKDIDEHGHVNNVIYLRWVQEVATAHWRAAATASQQADVSWFVVRHEIDYKHPVRLGEKVIARTWVGKATGRIFERHTAIIQEGGGRMMARARTLWCPIDIRTGKPVRVGADIRERFSVPSAEAENEPME